MPKKVAVLLKSAVLFSLANPLAQACPLCHSDTGALVRAGIFNESFAKNVFFAGMPFLVFGIIAALLHFGLPTWGSRALPEPTQILEAESHVQPTVEPP